MKRVYLPFWVISLSLIIGNALNPVIVSAQTSESSGVGIKRVIDYEPTKACTGDEYIDFSKGVPLSPGFTTDSPGTIVGTTWYDYQTNGSTGNRIAVDGYSGIHISWMNSQDDDLFYPRLVYYNYRNSNGEWLNAAEGTPVSNISQSGYTTLDNFSNSIPGVIFHYKDVPLPDSLMWLAIDSTLGGGHFNVLDLPDTVQGHNSLLWPYITIDNSDNIHYVVSERHDTGVPLGLCYLNSTDMGESWNGPFVVDTLRTISAICVSSKVSSKVAIVYTHPKDYSNQLNNDVYYIESQDGLNWDFSDKHNITDYSDGDNIRAYADVDALYDGNDNLHIIWNASYYSGGSWGMECKLWHWSELTGIDMIADGWWDSEPGAWNRTISKMSIGIDISGNLFAIWSQFNNTDISDYWYSNGDLYMAYSTDGGDNWSERVNMTDTQTPGCVAGECDSDHWSSLAEDVDEYLHIMYINDKHAGGIPQDEGLPTENPVIYLDFRNPIWPYDHNVGVKEILEPMGVIPIDIPIEPQVILRNDSLNSEAGAVFLDIGHVYTENLGFSLSPGEEDTIAFLEWTPDTAAAYITAGSIDLAGDEYEDDDILEGMVSVSAGYGPEIHQLNPDYGPSNQIATITVVGAGFEQGMTARLCLAGEQDIVADDVNFINETTIEVTLDLTGAVVDRWDFEVTNPADQSYRFYRGFDVVAFEGMLIPFCSWQDFIVHDGSAVEVFVNVPQVDELFVLMKKGNRIGYSGTWWGTIRLMRQGNVIAEETGSDDVEFHLENPAAGTYALRISAYDPGQGVIMVCSALDTLTLGEWYLGEVLRPYGVDWVQFDVPPGQNSLYLQSEGFGLWSTLDIFYENLDNPTEHWQFSNMGYGYHIEGQIQDPDSGRYYARYMDSAVIQGGDSQVREYLLFVDTDPIIVPPPLTPTITGLSTYLGGQGPVTVIVSGTGLDSAATVSLIRDSFNPIVADYVIGDSIGIELAAAFDLSQAEPGDWGFVVTNPGGESDTAASPFVVEGGGAPDLWLEIMGRNQIRIGRWSMYNIAYGNAGTIDINNPLLWINIPQEYQYQYDLPLTYSISDTAEPATILVLPYKVYAGESREFVIWFYTMETSTEVIEAGCVTLPLESFGQTGRLIKDLVLTDPDPGDMVFQYFYWGPVRMWVGHNGHYYEEDGIGRVIDFVDKEGDPPVKNVVRNLPFDDWKTMNGPNTYIGHASNWDEQTGQAIADEAFRRWEQYEAGQMSWTYQFIPILSGRDNCFSWGAKVVNHVVGEDLIPPAPWKAPILWFKEWGGTPENDSPAEEDEMTYPPDYETVIPVEEEDIEEYENQAIPDLMEEADTLGSIDIVGVGSSTPEDKYGPSGYDSEDTPIDDLSRFVNGDAEIDYRIDFWNHEEATAPAQIVFVEDTLDTDFEITSFGFTDIGFLRWNVPLGGGQYFNVNVDMRPDMDLIVNVEGTYDPDNRAVKWVFRSLDPITGLPPEDPMAGFLPPIDSTGYDIGWVDFTADLLPDLATGTEITNQAFVNFDSVGGYNPAPAEAPYLNTIDADPPISSMIAFPDSVSDDSTEVFWGGTDTDCGIATYQIYMADSTEGWPGNDFELWLTTPDTTAMLDSVQQGHIYSFYSVATDNVGNREIKSDTVEAQIKIILPPGFIAGSVTDEESAPIEGVYVIAVGTTIDDSTDSNGAYNLDSLDAVIHDVFFSHPDYRDTTVAGAAVAPRDTTILDIVMVELPGLVSGTVTDTSGVPIESVLVVIDEGGILLSEPGKVKSTAGAKRETFSNADDRIGQEDIDDAFAGDQLSVDKDDESILLDLPDSVYTDEYGDYEIIVYSGVYDLSWWHPDYHDTEAADVEITPGDTTIMNVEMIELPGVISGTVSDTSGVRIEGVLVEISENTILSPEPAEVSSIADLEQRDYDKFDGSKLLDNANADSPDKRKSHNEGNIKALTIMVDSVYTDEEGHYEAIISAGTYDISFSHPDYYDTEAAGEVITPGDTTTVDAEMVELPGIIAGVVTNVSSVPIESVFVEITESSLLLGDAGDIDPTVKVQRRISVGVGKGLRLALGDEIPHGSEALLDSVDSAYTDEDGYYEIAIPSGTYDISFSHPAYRDTTVLGVLITPGDTTIQNMILQSGCMYIAGDCDHNGTPLELSDVIAMIGTYRGTTPNPYTCSCPPHGDEFAATADPNGNCIPGELSDVVQEIGAYRGDVQASGCEDCPGSLRLGPGSEDILPVVPSLKSKMKSRERQIKE